MPASAYSYTAVIPTVRYLSTSNNKLKNCRRRSCISLWIYVTTKNWWPCVKCFSQLRVSNDSQIAIIIDRKLKNCTIMEVTLWPRDFHVKFRENMSSCLKIITSDKDMDRYTDTIHKPIFP